jgi:hypothetical protein
VNLPDVLEELAGLVRPIADLTAATAYPPDRVTPPAAFLRLPDEIQFDLVYGRGGDGMDMFLLIVAGKVDAASAHRRLARYASGSGVDSVRERIDAGNEGAASYDDAHVRSVDFAVTTIGGVDLLAAIFTIRVVGNGA